MSIITAVAGAVFGGIVTFIVGKLQQVKKILEWNVSSMPLVRFKAKANRPLKVMVDESVLTGKPGQQGNYVDVDTAFGFAIELANVGNQPIEYPKIEIRLSDSAKLIEFETQPAYSPGYPIEVVPDSARQNVLHVSPPYINDRERITVRLISTGNTTTKCTVSVHSVGVRARSGPGSWADLRTMLILALVYGLGMAILTLDSWAPHNLLQALGAHEVTARRFYSPGWLYVVSFGVLLVVLAGAVVQYVKLQRRWLRRAKGWDTDDSAPFGIRRFLKSLL